MNRTTRAPFECSIVNNGSRPWLQSGAVPVMPLTANPRPKERQQRRDLKSTNDSVVSFGEIVDGSGGRLLPPTRSAATADIFFLRGERQRGEANESVARLDGSVERLDDGMTRLDDRQTATTHLDSEAPILTSYHHIKLGPIRLRQQRSRARLRQRRSQARRQAASSMADPDPLPQSASPSPSSSEYAHGAQPKAFNSSNNGVGSKLAISQPINWEFDGEPSIEKIQPTKASKGGCIGREKRVGC
ncbi:hypothetical protein ACLOJK_027157 [Asimina triloba]